MSNISDLSWNKINFFSKLHLIYRSERDVEEIFRSPVVNRIGIDLDSRKRDSLSALSSTYYSVAGSSFSWIKIFPLTLPTSNPFVVIEIIFNLLQIPFWFLLGAYCFLHMLPTSNKMLKIAGGYGNLTADQCDIRQSILRARRKWDEALECIGYGLYKKPKPHCKALLLIGRAYCFSEIGLLENKQNFLKDLEDVLEIAGRIVKDEPRQTSRILRHSAILGRLLGNLGESYYQSAREIALRHGLKDQLLKM